MNIPAGMFIGIVMMAMAGVGLRVAQQRPFAPGWRPRGRRQN